MQLTSSMMQNIELNPDGKLRVLSCPEPHLRADPNLVETLLHSKSDDVVDVRLVGQVYDLYKEKCKKLEEANKRVNSFEKAVSDEVRLEEDPIETVCLLRSNFESFIFA